ncbi:aldo/keto reductase [Streptomyces sp. NPDC002928]|uniref:aldo/keto reductase n=1 Tax=Streptomyces sp. NPDC002928 TaxID=3154440 RepID=UPI0033B1F050
MTGRCWAVSPSRPGRTSPLPPTTIGHGPSTRSTCFVSRLDAVAAIATERGVSRAQVALAWVMHKPAVTAPIVGTTKPHHLTDAVAATELKLSAEELTRLEKHYTTHPDSGF